MIRARLASLILVMLASAYPVEAQPVAWRVEGMTRSEEEGTFRWRYTIALVNQSGIGITLISVEESRWVTSGATVATVEERGIYLRLEPFGTERFDARDELAESGKAHRTFIGRDDMGRAVRVDALVDLRLEASAVPRSPEVPPRPTAPPPAATRIPIRSGGTAPITVGGTVNGREQVTLILDTGASYTILSPRLLGRLGLSVPAAAPLVQFVIAGGQRVQAPLVTVDSLEIGHARVAPLEVLAYDAIPEDPNLDGLIGLNFLNHFAVNIDRGGGVLTLAPKSSER